MTLNEPWNDGVDLCTIVQEGHAAHPIDSYPGHIVNPMPSGKGIQEGSLVLTFHTWGVLPWGTFGMVVFP